MIRSASRKRPTTVLSATLPPVAVGAGAGGEVAVEVAAHHQGVTPPATPSMGALGAGCAGPARNWRCVKLAVSWLSHPTAKIASVNRARVATGRSITLIQMIATHCRRARDAPPPICGWSEKTLIVRSNDPDDDRPPFEEHYSVSPDGQRLIEEVGFKSGRSNGFTMSRVWDRVVQ